MKTSFGFSLLIGIALGGLQGCAPSPGAKVAADVKLVKEEQTPEKLLARGKAFASVGDYLRAEQYLSSAIDAGADPKTVLPILLDVCIAEQRFRMAIDYAERHLKKNPDDYRLRFVVASLYATVGDTKVALEELKKVAELKPDYAEAQFAWAVLLRDEEGDIVGADHHFREYLRLEPGGPHASEARGSLLKSMPQ